MSERSFVIGDQLLHASPVEGCLLVYIYQGINRTSMMLVEEPLRGVHPTEGVHQSVIARLAPSIIENLDLVRDVLAVDAVLAFRCGVEVCPQKDRLGVVRVIPHLIFRRVVGPDLLRILKSEGYEDRRLDLLEGRHLESTFLDCLFA